MKSFFTKATSANKRPWAVLLILGALLLLMRVISTPGNAQSPSASTGEQARGQRVLENKVPTDLPFTLRMKKEKEESFKDLKNENWLREFELELTNTGDKPIYFFYLTLVTDVRVEGKRLVFPLVYGRAELSDIVTKAGSEDSPIKPGETYVLKVHPGTIGAWETSVREQRFPQATRLQAVLQSLSFGDGTGLFGSEPYPSAGKKQSSLRDETPPRNKGEPKSPSLTSELSIQPGASSILDMPAVLVPANFLSLEFSQDRSAAPLADGCLFDQCIKVIPWSGYVCYDNGPHVDECNIQNRPGLSPDGFCKELEESTTLCVAGTVTYFCQTITIWECGWVQDPHRRPRRRHLPSRVSIATTQTHFIQQTVATQ